MTHQVAAVDLGATSGRVMIGRIGRDELSLHPVARFSNTPVWSADGLHWDIDELYREVIVGLSSAARREPTLSSIGVDSWAVDYALLRGGRMLGTPFHYRDARTAAGVEATHALVGPVELHAANGLQFLPFSTLYQLACDRINGAIATADSMLLIPDLLNYRLTGRKVTERTNASTTGLLGVLDREWNERLIERLGLPIGIFAPLVDAGTSIGALRPEIAAEIGVSGPLTVTAVGSHDTASAVVAIPAVGDGDFAYISCGTWGLVGVELDTPVLSEAGRLANFTNEYGVDGRIRYLRNVMGLWLLSESVRSWESTGTPVDLPALLDAATAVTSPVTVFDVSDPRFLAPGDLPTRIAEYCVERGEEVPSSPAEFVRSIVESLAVAFADAVRAAGELTGTRASVIHLVGGGAQNALLCQLTADRSGLPVLAGPVEATAVGNVLVQGRAIGAVSGSLESLRALVAQEFAPTRYSPRG